MALNSNLAVLETYLKDIIFSEADILTKVEVRDHIFEIKSPENVLGFISLYDLKAYIYEHEEEASNYSVKNIDSQEWKHIFDHPYFQRRKPQLVSSETLTNNDNDEEFYILSKGQKTGPFEKHQLLEMVEKREILLTDMVSFNAGHVWIKLFQVDGFDRRSLKESDQLPGMPDNTFLSKSSGETHTLGATADAMSSLAFLGNIKRGKTIEREREVFLNEEIAKKATGQGTILKVIITLSVVGIGYFLFNIKSHLSSPFEETAGNGMGEKVEMLTPVEMPDQNRSINNQRRTNKLNRFEPRPMKPVKPARKSYMETQQFQDGNNVNNEVNPPEDSNNYYYDNASPMELDPVRSQISKENFEEPQASPPEGEAVFNQEVTN